MTNTMILNRIQSYIDPILRPNQNGFRSGRSTTSHILTLIRYSKVLKHNLYQAIIIFIDYKKAFDSINRATMLHIPESYVIPKIIIKTIALTYKDTFANVTSPDGYTELFEIKRESSEVTH